MTPRAFIYRQPSTDQGTPGYFVCGSFRCFTLELPWRDNVRQKSCIPTGVYICTWQNSKKFGLSPRLYEVPGRSDILIHSGNWAGNVDMGYKSNSYGCILFAKKLGKLDGHLAGLMSRIAVREFREYMQGKPFILEVQNASSDISDS